MYSEKTRIALVAADRRAQQELGLTGHSPVAGSISLAGLGVSNAIHRGWLDSGEHDIAAQVQIAEWAGLNLPVR